MCLFCVLQLSLAKWTKQVNFYWNISDKKKTATHFNIDFSFSFGNIVLFAWRRQSGTIDYMLLFCSIVLIFQFHFSFHFCFVSRFFRCWKGPVSFSGPDRVGISVFSQVQDGRLRSVALFHPSQLHLDFDCFKCVPIKWRNGQVPIAKRIFKLRVATISPIAFSVVSTLALIGIILSIAFVAFNLHFRKLK